MLSLGMNTAETPRQLPHFATDEARWEAVQRRDRAADGAFFYSVRTTGVYCRPSCAARLARRANVSFHATAAAPSAPAFGPANAAGRTRRRSPSGRPPRWRRPAA